VTILDIDGTIVRTMEQCILIGISIQLNPNEIVLFENKSFFWILPLMCFDVLVLLLLITSQANLVATPMYIVQWRVEWTPIDIRRKLK
jgi:hypothetical protein